MIFNHLIHRIVTYAASPYIYKAVMAVDNRLQQVTPEQWKQVWGTLSTILRPFFVMIDWLRLGLTRIYLGGDKTSAHCIKALHQHMNAVSDIVYHKQVKPFDFETWTTNNTRSPSEVETKLPVYVVMLVLSPIFLTMDQLRCFLVKAKTPEARGELDVHMEAIWSLSYGSFPSF